MAHEDYATTTQTHPHYNETITPLRTIRDCVVGAWKIKQKSYQYLPHPSQIDKTSKEQQARYAMYLSLAEFDDYPSLTLRSWLGKMQSGKAQIETPERIEYLVQNADGDGTSLAASMESTISNLFQTKYHILVADYQGLSDVDLSALSKAEVDELAPRATIKQYTRESLVDWDFRRINGVMQLAYVKLREIGYEFDPKTMTRDTVESFLILALDEDGNYFQQKEVDGRKGDPDYVTVGGANLTWIPIEIVADDELPVGALPTGMGMLYPIVEASLKAYVDSANYGEARRTLVPTVFTKGWRNGDMEIFEQVNGRDYIAFGSNYANNLPNEVDVQIESVDDKTQAFERYLDRTKEKIRTFGGAVKGKSESTKTATEADHDSSNEVAMFTPIADNVERAYKRMISYCAMFEGVWPMEEVENRLDDIVLSLPRDFATPKLSIEEVRVLYEGIDRGVRTRSQVVKAMAKGGWDIQEAQQTLDELDDENPSPSSFLDTGGQTSNN